MQEEVNQKTVALSIRTTKLTGKVLAAALGKVVRALQKHHRKALTPQGRQSVKKLMNHYGGKSAMPYVGAPKDFTGSRRSSMWTTLSIKRAPAITC